LNVASASPRTAKIFQKGRGHWSSEVMWTI